MALSPGSVHVAVKELLPPVEVRPVGAARRGVTGAAAVAGPGSSYWLRARRRSLYCVPFVSPLASAEREDALPKAVSHVAPSSSLYCHLVTPVVGPVQESTADSWPAAAAKPVTAPGRAAA